MSAERIFISSTCYDLIDIRSEIEADFIENGLKPILSDRPTTEFSVIPDKNSIENCLINVKQSDIVIVILSQRYGPSLKIAGYPDLSATHLEYKEARKLNKPIYMYVRDRLESDYNIWRKNKGKDVKLSWVNKGDENIFNLLKEHRKLIRSDDKSNWFWIYRDSHDLRQTIRNDLKVIARKAILKRLIHQGSIAFLYPKIVSCDYNEDTGFLSVALDICNEGTSVAINPLFLFTGAIEIKETISTLSPKNTAKLTFEIAIIGELHTQLKNTLIKIRYTTLEGYYIADEFSINYKNIENINLHYQSKRFMQSDRITIES